MRRHLLWAQVTRETMGQDTTDAGYFPYIEYSKKISDIIIIF